MGSLHCAPVLRISPWLTLVTALASCSGPLQGAGVGQEMAVTLLEQGISEANPDAVRPLITDDYRQHNPRVPDGPQGLIGFVTDLAGLPEHKRTGVEVLRSFGDGEFVVTHSKYRRGGREISGIDVFRQRGGRFAEHWDVGMTQKQLNASGRGLFDGAVPQGRARSSATERTRSRVRRLLERGLIGRDHTELSRGISRGCVQHDPRLSDGRQSWIDGVERGDLVHTELVRVLASGQWALTQSRGRRGNRPVVINDLFKLRGSRVSEHWVVWESVPERMKHDNGML